MQSSGAATTVTAHKAAASVTATADGTLAAHVEKTEKEQDRLFFKEVLATACADGTLTAAVDTVEKDQAAVAPAALVAFRANLASDLTAAAEDGSLMRALDAPDMFIDPKAPLNGAAEAVSSEGAGKERSAPAPAAVGITDTPVPKARPPGKLPPIEATSQPPAPAPAIKKPPAVPAVQAESVATATPAAAAAAATAAAAAGPTVGAAASPAAPASGSAAAPAAAAAESDPAQATSRAVPSATASAAAVESSPSSASIDKASTAAPPLHPERPAEPRGDKRRPSYVAQEVEILKDKQERMELRMERLIQENESLRMVVQSKLGD